ncbi:serine/threonine-protein kinase [Planotetraspora kaengkrachanensis]|uniref:Protein kinase domain-containing protein n=1 Tax=Planotetraspora kaengkrachanensis TaxID=575193 RepID=A0A8J3PZZ2_9ACTN|nr:serine/threonine-protein kinase [Planotetraspora kaengkrachanensis]GIG84097.1 hypothetical protein Pka01_72240 [Planotetraspora kaengkrachanensis]
MAAGPLLPGDPQTLGAFQIVARLGEGGQGIVYEGRSASGERVAVKVLKGGADPDTRRRLARELESARRVAPFCTARVLAADLDRPDPFVVSEYVAGPSLHERVRELGPLREGDLDRLAVGTASALAAIHGAGVVHRDFKPANVLIGPDGPRVVDFGIARPLDAETAPTSLSGTPPYMTPEQLKGVHGSPAADVFSWASTMVYAATGHSPFGADTVAAVFNRILTEEPDLTGLPEGLRGVLAACLAKDPRARPSARSLMVRLVDPGAATVSVPDVGPVPTAYVPSGWSQPSSAVPATAVQDPTAESPIASGPAATKQLPADLPAPTRRDLGVGDTAPSTTPYGERPGRRTRRLVVPVAGVVVAALAVAGVLYAKGLIADSTTGDRPRVEAGPVTGDDPASVSEPDSATSPTSPTSPTETGTSTGTDTYTDTDTSTGTSGVPSSGRSAPSAEGITTAFAGTWTGQVESQDDRKKTVDIRITLPEGRSNGTVTREGCEQPAALTQVRSDTELEMAVAQKGLCVGGDVSLTLKDSGTLEYEGQEGAGSLTYRGSLHRS